MKITNETAAVITGGASGLGYATAKALVEQGARVALFDVNAENGAKAARELGAVFCEVDVTSEDSCLAGFEKARAANGQERILVNCAGGGRAGKTISRDKTTGEISRYATDTFNFVIQLNLIGTFRCTTMSAAGMAALEPTETGERGVITCTASVAAHEGQVGQVAYAAAKSGINGIILPAARDMARDGIRINAIMPGLFATPLLMNRPEKVLQSLAEQVPFPARLGLPEEYASLVLELVRNAYFNGQSIRLDGAIRMAPR
jgi:NAD(P)-dependent dehydrogenase (short-subunit alcohol dehydrogenase family)